MTKGFLIKYKPVSRNDRTYLHQKMFGMLTYRKKRGLYTATYKPGMMANIPYWRLEDGLIFVEKLDGINFDVLKALADIDVQEAEVDTEEPRMTTAIYKFKKLAEKKNAMFVN